MARNDVTVVQKLGSSLAFMDASPDRSGTTSTAPLEPSTSVDTFYIVKNLNTREIMETMSRSYLPEASSRTSMSMATYMTVSRRNNVEGILTS